MKIFKLMIVCLLLSVCSFSAEKYDFVVALDGSGNYTSIQKAIDASKAFPDERVSPFL